MIDASGDSNVRLQYQDYTRLITEVERSMSVLGAPMHDVDGGRTV